MKKYKFILLSASALVSSCGESFDPDFDIEPIAVLNSMVMPGNEVTATISHSYVSSSGSMSPSAVADRIIKDAIVELYVNDVYVGNMEYDATESRYISQTMINSGDLVKIKAATSRYGNAIGSTCLPREMNNASWSFTVTTETDYDTSMISPDGSITHPKSRIFNYAITFTDPADDENYYFLMSESFDFECDDPIMGENDSPLDAVYSNNSRYLIFSDRSISGKQYTINCKFKKNTSSWWDVESVNNLCLYSISKDYYLYLLSIYKKYEGLNGALESIGLAEPKFVYSNVNPGVGIVASQTPVVDIRHDISEYLEEE